MPPISFSDIDLHFAEGVVRKAAESAGLPLVVKVTVPWETYTDDRLASDSPRYAPRDVARIDFAVEGPGRAARLTLDLEGTFLTNRRGEPSDASWASADGPVDWVEDYWHDITDLFDRRKISGISRVLTLPATKVVLVVTVMLLPLLSVILASGRDSHGAHVVSSGALGIGSALGVVAGYLSSITVDRLFPRIAVSGWGRRYASRQLTMGFVAAVAASLVASAILAATHLKL